MPHSLFLGSALATQDRISSKPPKAVIRLGEQNSKPTALSHIPKPLQRLSDFILSSFWVSLRQADDQVKPKRHSDRENNPLSFVQAHLYHGMIDIAVSLLGFAILINSLYVPAPLLILCY